MSAFEMLPAELLARIFTYVNLPFVKASSSIEMPQAPNMTAPTQHLSLYNSLSTSRALHAAAISVLYRRPVLNSPQAFELFLNQLSSRPELGSLIKELDLTNLTLTLDDDWIRGVGPRSLISLLNLTPLLQEIKIGSEHGGGRLHGSAWDFIFSQLAHLRTVCINDSDSRKELQHFHFQEERTTCGPIRELSVTKTFAMPQKTVRNILSSQPRLQSLNFSGSLIAGDWFSSLSTCARIQHLDLSDCLGGRDEDGLNPTADFLSSHPAITHSLQSLNLRSHSDLPTLNLTTEDLTLILSNLPIQTMKSLDLRGTPLLRDQLPLLQRLVNLEKLHVSNDFFVRDMETLVLGKSHSYPTPYTNLDPAQELLQVDPSKMANTSDLGPLARSVLVCKLMQRVNRVVPKPECSQADRSKLRYLDLSGISRTQVLKILDSVLLAEESKPLEVIELGQSILDWCDVGVKHLFRSAGWKTRCVGKRSWIERI